MVDSLFNIEFIITDPISGCDSKLISDIITVFHQPVASFTAANTCNGTESTLYDNSNSINTPLNTWWWNFGDTLALIDTSSLQFPAPYIYSSFGVMSVSLTITDQNLCQDSTSQDVTIFPNPIVDFNALNLCEINFLCANELSSFNDSSYVDNLGGLLTNEYWFIDNIFSDSSIYTQTYNTMLSAGIHNIKHIVKSEYGCLDSISRDFEVINVPVPFFNVNDTICGNDTSLVQLNNLSYGNILLSYLQISNSLDSIVLIDSIYNDTSQIMLDLNPGSDIITYYISLTVSNCCGDSTYLDSLVILPNPQVFFVTNPICDITPLPVNNPLYLYFTNFVDTINTDSVIINWGDGTNSGIIYPDLDGGTPVWPDLSHSYSSVNTFNICITGYNNCDSTTYCCSLDVIPNQINSSFQIIQNYSCVDDTCGIKLWELSSPGFNNATVNWWFNYNPDSITNYPNLGNPDLSIPYSQFDTICWQYDEPGWYLILHEITAGPIGGPVGPTFSDTSVNWLDTVIVYPQPEINFSCIDVCLFDTTTFINNSTINNSISKLPNQSINSWQWYIDNQPITNAMDLDYSFSIAGTYWVKLKATSNYGCISMDSCQINVFDLPIAKFVSNSVCDEINMCFLDSSQEANFPLVQWEWTIEEGVFKNSNNNSQNPCFLFDNCGLNKMVILFVEDSFGCLDYDTAYSEVFCNPISDFSTDPIICHNSTTYFFDQSIGVTETIIDWSWNFGLNASLQFSSNQNDSTSYYMNNGNQNIQLTVTDQNNCSSTKDSVIFINDNPTASFSWKNICAGEPTSFLNNSTYSLNSISQSNWEFSDGGISSQMNPNYNFNVVDTIGARSWAILQITDNAGCKDTFDSRLTNKDIEIHPLPSASFVAEPICYGDNFTFINTSYISQLFNDNINYPNPLWDFENGDVTSNDNTWYFSPSIINYSSGVYDLTLNIESSFISEYSNKRCFSNINKNVEILTIPNIEPDTFWTNNQCGTDVEFTFNANPLNVNTYSYFISDIYNNNLPITNTHNFTYKFNYPGTYLFDKFIYNLNGCSDSISETLHVYPNPTANYIPSNNEGCEDLIVNFIDNSFIQFDSLYENGLSEIISWNWTYDDGQSSSNQSTNNTYNSINGVVTNYSPSLYVETNFGCNNLIRNINSISVHPSPIAIISTPVEELGPGLFNFNASESITSNGFSATTNDFNFLWITNEDTLFYNINELSIDYQYPPNLNYPNSDNVLLYDLTLVLIDKNSLYKCSDTTSIVPGLFVDYFKGLYLPNALAPNDKSGETSYFLPKGQSLEEYHLEIFDTWGNLVWQTREITIFDKKPSIPWMGNTMDDKPLPQGTYVWKIYAKFTDGSNWQGINGKTTGSIYLIR